MTNKQLRETIKNFPKLSAAAPTDGRIVHKIQLQEILQVLLERIEKLEGKK